MTDKLRSLSMLVFATAALIGALAALVFVLRVGDARAEPSGGSRYQLGAMYDSSNKYVIFEVLDTYTGHIWEKDGPNDEWDSLGKQLDPTKKR